MCLLNKYNAAGILQFGERWGIKVRLFFIETGAGIPKYGLCIKKNTQTENPVQSNINLRRDLRTLLVVCSLVGTAGGSM